jgi:hypothetical protein
MLKFLAGASVGVVAIYAVQELSAVYRAEPELKVWVKQTHIPPNGDPYDLLVIQSRAEAPVAVKGILVNDDPRCLNVDAGTYKAGTPLKLGEVQQFGLGIHGFNACDPVKVVVTTDHGQSTYRFDE